MALNLNSLNKSLPSNLYYNNDRKYLGVAEIINILDKEQPPTQKDVTEMSLALRWIGMDLKLPHLNLTHEELKSTVDQILVKDRSLKDYNIFVLVLIAHGCNGDVIISSDGKESVTVSELVNRLDALEDMNGRPKVLIIESCRGGSRNTGFEVKFLSTKDASSGGIKKLPNLSDIFIAYSTVPDQVSHTTHIGSPFLITLAERLKELAKTQHFADILTIVRADVSKMEFQGDKKQLPQVTTTLLKNISLFVSDKNRFQEGITSENVKAPSTRWRYYGDLVNGKSEGNGMIVLENGDFYIGNWKNELQHGKGFYDWSGGACYEGDWENGVRSGKGVYIFDIRDELRMYDGEWKDDKRNGNGIKYCDYELKRYEGEWKDDKYHGNGIEYLLNGQKRYEGEWKDDKRNGNGIEYYLYEQKRYEGEWKDDKRNGNGIECYLSGQKMYEGEWEDDKRNGNGIEYYGNGQKAYEGEFKDDNLHGNGILYFPNGDIYIGRFKNNRFNGFGTKMSKDKKVIKAGFWKNGELKTNVFD